MEMHQRAIKVGRTTVGVSCNNVELLYNRDYFDYGAVRTLLSDFPSLEDVPFNGELDGYMNIIDNPSLPLSVIWEGNVLTAAGDFGFLEENTGDLRFSLFGNLGLFSRFVLLLGEMKHDEYSFHATAMFDEEQNRLIISMGKAAAGKSTCLLAGIDRGYRVLSTERVIYKISGKDVKFYRGSTLDNVWNTNLHYDFPGLIEKFGIDVPKPDGRFGQRVGVDMAPFAIEEEEIINPEIVILLPMIQISDVEPSFRMVGNQSLIKKNLFDNAGNKLDQTFILYERLTVPPLESAALAQRRLEAVEKLMELAQISKVYKIISGPGNCLDCLDSTGPVSELKGEYK